jgi:hypothetical protein
METAFDFKHIENFMETIYINNLIKACEKQNINKTVLEKKLYELKENDNTISESNQSLKKVSDSSVESPKEQQYCDDYLYQKPWTKLTPIHKIIKIKEFVNLLLINDESDKQVIKEKLVDMVKTKILTKKDMVLYDMIKGRIISIPMLQYQNGKYLI